MNDGPLGRENDSKTNTNQWEAAGGQSRWMGQRWGKGVLDWVALAGEQTSKWELFLCVSNK